MYLPMYTHYVYQNNIIRFIFILFVLLYLVACSKIIVYQSGTPMNELDITGLKSSKNRNFFYLYLGPISNIFFLKYTQFIHCKYKCFVYDIIGVILLFIPTFSKHVYIFVKQTSCPWKRHEPHRAVTL
jgi:hypothetical protein